MSDSGLDSAVPGGPAVPDLGAPDVSSVPVEVQAIDWIFARVAEGRPLPVAEAETVINSMYSEQVWGGRIPFPLVPVTDSAGFHAVHAVNVAALSMALAGSQQFDPPSMRAVGLAALLHDIGMARIPSEVWLKEGQLTPAEREQVKRHPIEGATLLLGSGPSLDLASVVAYEHHLRMDGSGYPSISYARPAHFVSRLVQVCDVFCALSANRPYRVAWPLEVILSFLEERSGFEFHPTIAASLTALVRDSLAAHAALQGDRAAIRSAPSAD